MSLWDSKTLQSQKERNHLRLQSTLTGFSIHGEIILMGNSDLETLLTVRLPLKSPNSARSAWTRSHAAQTTSWPWGRTCQRASWSRSARKGAKRGNHSGPSRTRGCNKGRRMRHLPWELHKLSENIKSPYAIAATHCECHLWEIDLLLRILIHQETHILSESLMLNLRSLISFKSKALYGGLKESWVKKRTSLTSIDDTLKYQVITTCLLRN